MTSNRAFTETLPRVFKNRYQVTQKLGEGGSGTVYLAKDLAETGKMVVVKVLHAHIAEKEGWRKRFVRESEALKRIHHSGVVGWLDGGEEYGVQFIIMEFVEGKTLRALIEPEGMDFDEVADIIEQLGSALTAAHNAGVYHRDLKPGNIMIKVSGDAKQVKIVDFSIATVKDNPSDKTLETDSTSGTPPYMAPQQVLNKPSASTDIYALGVIAYEMITGRRPFHREAIPNVVALYFLQKEGIKIKPKELRPNLPAAAQNIILKALAFKAEERFQTAEEFGKLLAAALRGEIESFPEPSPNQQKQLLKEEATRTVEVEKVDKAESLEKASIKKYIYAAVVACILIIAGLLVVPKFVNRALPTANMTIKPSNSEPVMKTSLSYSFRVKRASDNKIFDISREVIFAENDKIQLNITAKQEGFLYILNQGPTDDWNILFPAPNINNGASWVTAGQKLQLPEGDSWFFLDGESGDEKVWLI
ncbi:MAG: protein kinase, partial [Blastocatellia bacterium]|nr:protein kinase [Blastocatellia bacterium]